MSAIRAYVAAAILLLPVGACLELSARAPGAPPSDERTGLSAVYCGASSESCEMLP